MLIDRGDSYTVTRDFALPVGISDDFFIIVQTDAHNQVFEHAFEGNNTGFDATPTTINLTPPPDLEVELVDAPAEASRNLTITYTVANLGATATPNSQWQDSFYLSTDLILDPLEDLFLGKSNHFGSLDLGSSYQQTATFPLPNGLTGDFHVLAVTDSGDQVFELDKSNNIGWDSEVVTISSLAADLLVTSASTATVANAGKSILVEWTVTNSGMGDTRVESWRDRIVASADPILGNGDDVTLGTVSRHGSLAVGQSYQRQEVVAIPFSFQGDYNLYVVTDSGHQVYEELGFDNNVSEVLPLSVSRLTSDLQVKELSAPVTGASGELFPVSWTVTNAGLGDTNSNRWHDEVFLSTDDGNQISLGRVFHSGVLANGSQYQASASFQLPVDLTGEVQVQVVTDVYNRVTEEDENNNQAIADESTVVSLSPVPDLEVTMVDAPQSAISSQLLDLTWTVRNAGADASSQSWRDAFYLSRDQIFDPTSDIYLGFATHQSGLAAGSSSTRTTSLSVPAGLSGPFYLFANTDSGHAVYERHGESNNLGYDGNSLEIILPEPVDLVAGEIGIPLQGVPGTELTVSYTVTNSSGSDFAGRWTDSIYISADGVWDIADPLLGRVEVDRALAAGDSYRNSLTEVLPGVVPGDYHLILRSDITNLVLETDEDNNLAVSTQQFSADFPPLTLGESVTNTLAREQSLYYSVAVEAGETLRFSLDSQSSTAANELYVRYGDVPSRSEFDVGFNRAFAPDQEVVIPFTQAGTYYLLAYGDPVSSPQTVQLEAAVLDFEISSLSRNSGGNAGTVTIEILGAKFDGLTEVSLVTEGEELLASRLDWLDPSRLFATFDLTDMSPGVYDVVASRSTGETAVLEDGFTVETGGSADLVVDVSYPAATRPETIIPMTIQYANQGNIDLASPLALLVSQSGAPLALSPGELGHETHLELLLQDSQDVFGVLPPGATGSLTVYTQATAALDFSLTTFQEPDTPLNWDGYVARFPEELALGSAEVFREVVGETVGELQSNLLALQQSWLQLQESELRRAGNVPSQEDYLSFSVEDLLGAAAFAAFTPSDESVEVGDELTDLQAAAPRRDSFSIDGSLYEGFLQPGDLVGYILQYGGPRRRYESRPVKLTTNPEGIFKIEGDNRLVLAKDLALDYEDDQQPKSYTIVLDRTDTTKVEAIEITIPVKDVKIDFRVLNGSFDSSQPTYLVTHGFKTNADKSDGLKRVSEEILSNGQIGSNANVVVVDWREGAAINAVNYQNLYFNHIKNVYDSAATNTLRVGDEVAQWLQKQNLTGSITLIGQSLGAHLVGDAATEYNNLIDSTNSKNSKIGTIVGLDPAGPVFENKNPDLRLDPDDAEKVIAVHTSTLLGYEDVLGDFDLYVNPIRSDNGSVSFYHPSFPNNENSNHAYVYQFLTKVLDNSQTVYDYNDCDGQPDDCEDRKTVDWEAIINPGSYVDGQVGGSRIWDVQESEITLSNNFVEENSPNGTVIGNLITNQSGDYSFKLTDDAGGRFRIENDKLIVANGYLLDYEAQKSHDIKVKLNFFHHSSGNIIRSGEESLLEIKVEDVCEPGEQCDDPPDDPPNGFLPPSQPPDNNNNWSIPIITSSDPNDIVGPGRFGEENWVSAAATLPYTIRFENQETATAPAQEVVITHPLDEDLDWRTFRLGSFGWGDLVFEVPENRSFYSSRLDLTESDGFFVDVFAGIDIELSGL